VDVIVALNGNKKCLLITLLVITLQILSFSMVGVAASPGTGINIAWAEENPDNEHTQDTPPPPEPANSSAITEDVNAVPGHGAIPPEDTGIMRTENTGNNDSINIRVTGTDTTEPVVVQAVTGNNRKHINVKFNIAMADPVGKHGQFTVTVNNINNMVTDAALLSSDSTIVVLTVNSAVFYNDIVKLSYTAGDVAAANGQSLNSLSDFSVSNAYPYIINAPANKTDHLAAGIQYSTPETLPERATVVFQVMNGNTPVELISIENYIQDKQEFMLQLNLLEKKKYKVNIMVWNNLKEGNVMASTKNAAF